jgi:N-methylhydantoinase A
VTLQKGHDPRDFTLVPFGGAGPLHAVEVARDLQIPKVLVPLFPGLASAFGQLHVDLRHDLTRPVFRRQSELDLTEFNGLWVELEREAHELLVREEGIEAERIQLERQADLKYYPQSFYLTLPIPDGELKQEQTDELFDLYNETHLREFGYTIPSHAAEIEIGQIRLVATGLIDKPALGQPGGANGKPTSVSTRRVYFEEHGGWIDTKVFGRDDLTPGFEIEGPAVIDQFDSTTVVPPESKAVVDDYANLTMDVRV